MLSEKQLEILRERRAKVLAGGGEDKLQERHAKGLMGARERLLTLFQPDTFQEIAARTPQLTLLKPAGEYFPRDMYDAGGLAALAGETGRAGGVPPFSRVRRGKVSYVI
jgi:acetyl-CoA carboxylase carboxyltransferase component